MLGILFMMWLSTILINSPDNLKSHGKNIASYLICVKILSRISIRFMAALAIATDEGLIVTSLGSDA